MQYKFILILHKLLNFDQNDSFNLLFGCFIILKFNNVTKLSTASEEEVQNQVCLTAGALGLTKEPQTGSRRSPWAMHTEDEFDWLIDAFLSQVVNQI